MNARPRSDEKAHVILAAALKVLAERGYAATTVAQVAAEAGVSRGLLHYHFESKEALLARVVHASIEPSLMLLEPMLAAGTSGASIASALTRAVRGLIRTDPAVFTLVFEGWAVSRQSEMVAREMRRMFRRFRAAMEAGLSQAKARGAIDPPMPVESVAMLATALMDGLALQLVLDPELAQDEVVWTSLETSLQRLLGTTP